MKKQIAAIDLGSNSFRLQIAEVENGQVFPLDQLKRSVRLAAGLQADKTLSSAVKKSALEALSLFAQRLSGFNSDNVRAVATNTMRVAHDTATFVQEIEQTLGFPVEIISGHEEARLIYLGALHTIPASAQRRLVFDIGGGSTEFIIARQEKTEFLASIAIGCVSYSQNFFSDGQVSKKKFRNAQITAAREIAAISADCHALAWSEVYATSGTAAALVEIAEANNLNPKATSGLSRIALEQIKNAFIEAGNIEKVKLLGLRPERIPVICGGLAVMLAVFDTLNIEQINFTEGALRLGVLYDMINRGFPNIDQREKSITFWQNKLSIDRTQAAAVTSTALRLFAQLTAIELNQSNDNAASIKNFNEATQFLRWAAEVHEIGRVVSYASYHKHGAYFLTYADMPGFSRREQQRLATLILAHRGKLNKINLPNDDINWQAIICLRIATILHRARSESQLPDSIALSKHLNKFQLLFPENWLAEHPLIEATLQDEIILWESINYKLAII